MTDILTLIDGLSFPLLAGVFCVLLWVWQSGRARLRQARAELAQRSETMARTDAALSEAMVTLEDLRSANADLRANLSHAQALAGQLPETTQALADTRQQLEEARITSTRLMTDLQNQKDRHAEQVATLQDLRGDLEQKFANLATGALQQNSQAFLAHVTERFEKHSQEAEHALGQRQQAIKTLVDPLQERLTQFDSKMSDIEKARLSAYTAIETQVQALTQGQQALGSETRKLVQALRAPKTRGRWGEMQLKQVFEMSGMSEHVDFALEQTMEGDTGRLRPDAIVNIPGGKQIIVDAKTPLDAYLDSLEAVTVEDRNAQIIRHGQQLKKHIRDLSSKSYQDLLTDTPDFVVMFIPGEPFVAAAAEADPRLMEYAFDNKVLIATPTTLMALVKTIAYGWQQDKMARNAADVQKLAKEIYDRLGTFAGALEKVGKSLGTSVTHYNTAVGSLEGRLLPSARKFEALGVVPASTAIEPLNTLTHVPRPVTAPERAKDD